MFLDKGSYRQCVGTMLLAQASVVHSFGLLCLPEHNMFLLTILIKVYVCVYEGDVWQTLRF